jgi:hypothetical protein
MVVECQLNYAEMSEAFRLNRTPVFWFKAAVANLRAIILIIVVAAMGTAKIVNRDQGNWQPIVGLVGFAIVLFLLYVWRQRKGVKKALAQMNAVCSEMTVNAEGVKLSSAIGAMNFTPWSHFTKWSEGNLVFTIVEAKGFRALPKRALTDSQMTELRGMLQTQILRGAQAQIMSASRG